MAKELTTMTKSHYQIETIQLCCSEYRTGTTVSELCRKYQIPRSTMYYWVKKYADLPNATRMGQVMESGCPSTLPQAVLIS